MENFDYNIVYEHRTEFMVGKLGDIRKRFNQMAAKTPPAWRFMQDRQHWSLRNATDQGFPCKGEWRIKCSDKKLRLESGIRCWKAEDAPELTLKAAYTGKEPVTLQIFWKRLDEDNFESRKSLSLKLDSDGGFHTYHLALNGSTEYRGLITGLAIEPAHQTSPGAEVAIQSIVLTPSPQPSTNK